MKPHIPSSVEILALLKPLDHSQMLELSRISGVPLPTLWNIRGDRTKNPGIETVRKFLRFVSKKGVLQGQPSVVREAA